MTKSKGMSYLLTALLDSNLDRSEKEILFGLFVELEGLYNRQQVKVDLIYEKLEGLANYLDRTIKELETK